MLITGAQVTKQVLFTRFEMTFSLMKLFNAITQVVLSLIDIWYFGTE